MDTREFVGVQWHVENDGQPLPFTRGCSIYKVDLESYAIGFSYDLWSYMT